MNDVCIIPSDNPIGASFRQAVRSCSIIFVAGLPSSGKSLMLQQLTILAHQAARQLHTMQWDTARRSFETGKWLKRYPERDNLTHPGIRKAVGLWVRPAITKWMATHAGTNALLVAELPVVGGRFAELLQPLSDTAEPVLASEAVRFFVPVPTHKMRKVITARRANTFANPRNEEETRDAPLHIVEEDWITARRLYNCWNGIDAPQENDAQYCPQIYHAVFTRLLRYRHHQILDVTQSFETSGSAHDRTVPVVELAASPTQVEQAFADLERLYPGTLAEKAVDGWANY